MKLTDEQQKIVADNHNLIYWYLNKRNLSIDDYYDLLAIELCVSAMKYDESRGSFSNYFKLRADGVIYKEYRMARAKKREHTKVALVDNMYESGYDTEDVLDVMNVQELLDGEYGDVLKLRLQGYTQVEIAEMFNTNQTTISRILRKAKLDYERRISVDR